MAYDFDSLWKFDVSESIIKFNEKILNEQLEDGWNINLPLAKYALQGIEKFPIMLAIKYNNMQSIEFLIKNGAVLDIGNSHAFLTAIEFCNKELIKYLVGKGARVKVSDKIFNAYDIATNKGKVELIPIINELGLPLNPYSFRSLYKSIYDEEYNILDILIEQGTELNCNCSYEWNGLGNTSLGHAAAYSTVNMIQYLIKKGADPLIKNKFGKTPYILARTSGKHENANYLSQFGNQDIIKIKEELPKEIYDYINNSDLKLELNNSSFVNFITFLPLKDLYYIKFNNKKLIVLTEMLEDYPDLYLAWYESKKSMVYFDEEHNSYGELKVDFNSFLSKPEYYLNKIFCK